MKPARLKTHPSLKLSFPEISPEKLEKIKKLEKELGNICLVAVERPMAIYVLEAKIDKNQWVPVDQFYPEIEGLKSYYQNYEDAKLAKAGLKSLLIARAKEMDKRPIRIRKIEDYT